jgi:hypothetical protein
MFLASLSVASNLFSVVRHICSYVSHISLCYLSHFSIAYCIFLICFWHFFTCSSHFNLLLSTRSFTSHTFSTWFYNLFYLLLTYFSVASSTYLDCFSYVFRLLLAFSSVPSLDSFYYFLHLKQLFFHFFELFLRLSLLLLTPFSVNSHISQLLIVPLSLASWNFLSCLIYLFQLLFTPSFVFRIFYSHYLDPFQLLLAPISVVFSSIIRFCISFSYFLCISQLPLTHFSVAITYVSVISHISSVAFWFLSVVSRISFSYFPNLL